MLARRFSLPVLAAFAVGCAYRGTREASLSSAALQQACMEATTASDGDVVPDDEGDGEEAAHNGNNGNHSSGDPAELLSGLASSDDLLRDRAALHLLRKARAYGDPIVAAAASVAGELADWRADRPLVWILRNRFPASSRTFSSPTRANAALALGLIAQIPRGEPPTNGHEGEPGHEGQNRSRGGDVGDPYDDHHRGVATTPDYVLHAVAAAACPPESPDVRNAAIRALGEMRDAEAVPLLNAILSSPSTGDDVQDRLLVFTASRAITMIEDQNATTPAITARTRDALAALKESLPGGEVAP